MTVPGTVTTEDRERRLRKIWLLRQLHSVVLLAVLLVLYILADRGGFDTVARITLICLVALPFFATAIAWWDAHWVRKHQDRLLGASKTGQQP